MTSDKLVRGSTVYQLTANERNVMKRLTDAGMVVGVGRHSRLRNKVEIVANSIALAAGAAQLPKNLRAALQATADELYAALKDFR